MLPLKLTAETYAAKLQRFRLHGQVWLTPEEIPDDADVPPTWRAILEAADDVFADLLTSMWSCVIQRLPSVENFFRENLQRPAVLQLPDRSIRLLYPFTIEQDDLNFFIGRPPLASFDATTSSVLQLPPGFADFYRHVHDGWTFFPTQSMGPLSLDEQSMLIDKLDVAPGNTRSSGIRAEHIRCVFHNGAGDYLCLDLRESRDEGCAAGRIWWHEDPEKLEAVDFWPTMDAWIGIFLEEADRR